MRLWGGEGMRRASVCGAARGCGERAFVGRRGYAASECLWGGEGMRRAASVRLWGGEGMRRGSVCGAVRVCGERVLPELKLQN